MTENKEDMRNWLTIAEAARRLEVSEDTVRNYCRRGLLVVGHTHLGRLIEPESVERLKEILAQKGIRRRKNR